ncbi:hypothetical protein KOW79_003381 [Hemibagrus wyckioides]|uniref:Uncharacterized protein n=1 Tax=Hemibagrus wyckioides TaxID=337641 RepID=A0A9D3SQ91_9TELE|nr:hypothetical protein KOW79_003381 [Hemibagrus wyckioides]
MEGWGNVPAAPAGVEARTELKIESDIEQEPENSWGRPLTSDDLSSESTDMDTEMSSYASHAPGSITKRSDMVLKLRKVYYTKGQRGQVSHYQRVPNQSEVQRGRHGRCHRKKKQRSSEPSLRHRNTHRTMRNRYPDLVGKRIRHLYEENDKTEVWYKGVVLRIHESHPNPLKTVFEVKYDSEPEWQYYLELLMDYKKGWLQIED